MKFSSLNKQYIAIIGDVKGSRELENRSDVQRMLKKVLDEINIKYDEYIASKFLLTLGDEFQGLLCNGTKVMDIISEIERELYPIKVRYGIGIGLITTDINKEMAIGADGPGYYRARSAIEYLKDNEKKKQRNVADIRFEFKGDNQGSEMMVNTILSLMTVIKEAWSDRQREIIWDMMKHQDSQMEAAKRLGIQQPAVQKSLSKGNYYSYKEALETIGTALEEIRRQDV